MDSKTVADLYQQSSVENAPPIQVVRMLYKGALRFLTQALLTDPEKDSAAFNSNLGRADAIVNELRCSLEHEVAPELATNLEQLYMFVENEIAHASIDRDRVHLETAKRILTTLLEGWRDVHLNEDVTESRGRGDGHGRGDENEG